MEGKKIIILIGPPGSGKGTQAEMLAEKFGLFNFETSKIIEEKFADARSDDAVINREKQKWTSGQLVSPEIILGWMTDKIAGIKDSISGIVFSGSPRTLHEAKGLMPILQEYFGKENIKLFNIELSEGESIKRNSSRRICQANRHSIPNFPEFAGVDKCPKDGSPLITRPLDNPEVIKNRYRVYLSETFPILELLKSQGYEIIKINGEQPIDKVQADILDKLSLH